MANEKEPTPGTRGARLNDLRKTVSLSREQLASELARVADELDLRDGGEWSQSRVSKLILGRQIMSLDDATAIVYFAEERRLKGMDWDWLALDQSRRAIVRNRKPTKVSGGHQQTGS
jgi:hypothetical protein